MFETMYTYRIEPGSSTVGQKMGYCPQVDALDPYLSIINTLNFHASLKGINGSARKQVNICAID